MGSRLLPEVTPPDGPARDVVELAAELVRIPSRGGVDSPLPILEFLSRWTDERTVPSEVLHRHGAPVGLVVRRHSNRPGLHLCLAACVDTAPFGDERRWSRPPTEGAARDGRLWGRGAADSKAGAAVFARLAVEAASIVKSGELSVLFDGDEHTGQFGGILAYLDAARPPDAVVIGYPGNEAVMVGARGFLRAAVAVHGVASHSGARTRTTNAVEVMGKLIARLTETPLPGETDARFAFGPRATVTEVVGGNGYSQVPDLATAKVDVRLTPAVSAADALAWLEAIVRRTDAEAAVPCPSEVSVAETWPPYCLADDNPVVCVLQEAAQAVFGRRVPTAVCGPSNIGNLLATRGIPAVCGFGVTGGGIHATDEWADVESMGHVFEVYRRLLHKLLG